MSQRAIIPSAIQELPFGTLSQAGIVDNEKSIDPKNLENEADFLSLAQKAYSYSQILGTGPLQALHTAEDAKLLYIPQTLKDVLLSTSGRSYHDLRSKSRWGGSRIENTS